ncbi:MAG: bifunctional aldolase/short-chain dehydrogenase [Acidimicrobiaceae bacterium]|nr:bifunctional aldolase/short-chain dehydrogenase [Acidimicrobiaceae bacterium]|tara:strand:+ start:39124 stop:41097 length:1974 start_codon:yes stop_codon:yes gene_type:complete
MKNLWNADDAAKFPGALGECVYGSRLLGAESSLVLHGGGNTSVKATETDIHGDLVDVLYVKGSGWDLATIEPQGFAPLRLEAVRRLAELPSLSDIEMVNQLRLNLLDASAPNPSVEAILHASLPFIAVQHTHADAALALTNTKDGERRVRELWGESAVIVPYVMPGFDLAKACALEFDRQANSDTVAMVLMNHGVFTFGETTEQAYNKMIEVITEAEDYLVREAGVDIKASAIAAKALSADGSALDQATLRNQLSHAAGRSMLLARTPNERANLFSARSDLGEIACRGPATPDHIIRTKQFPLIGRDVEKFVSNYHSYFERNQSRFPGVQELDPAPRVVLDPDLGLLTAGTKIGECEIASDIYLHTIDVIEASEGLGGFVALPETDLFEVEYWELEQAKLAKSGGSPPLSGEVALVTGSASGIGKACAESLISQGAAVIGIDLNTSSDPVGSSLLELTADVTDRESLTAAVHAGVERFGGIDIVVAAAGIFGSSNEIADIVQSDWEATLSVNLNGVSNLLHVAHPFLTLSPQGGRVLLVGSKNVPAPGKGAAAYSASKAAVTQLGRVAALEWAQDGIVVNMIHPDGVFDTGLWSQELVEQRAANYGITADEYKRRNLLGKEITSNDIGDLVAAMCGDLFRQITGAQIPIDGGSDRVI